MEIVPTLDGGTLTESLMPSYSGSVVYAGGDYSASERVSQAFVQKMAENVEAPMAKSPKRDAVESDKLRDCFTYS